MAAGTVHRTYARTKAEVGQLGALVRRADYMCVQALAACVYAGTANLAAALAMARAPGDKLSKVMGREGNSPHLVVVCALTLQ